MTTLTKELVNRVDLFTLNQRNQFEVFKELIETQDRLNHLLTMPDESVFGTPYQIVRRITATKARIIGLERQLHQLKVEALSL